MEALLGEGLGILSICALGDGDDLGTGLFHLPSTIFYYHY